MSDYSNPVLIAGRTLLISAADISSIANGCIVVVDDADGHPVDLAIHGGGRHIDGRPRVVLSPRDLDLIEELPEGLVCGASGGGTGWTVRVAS